MDRILEAAERKGTLVVNRCQSLRDCNEKVFATQFPQCCPPVLVSASMPRLKEFQALHGDTIFKPLDSMGGDAIFRVRPGDPNISVILELLTHRRIADGIDVDAQRGERAAPLGGRSNAACAVCRLPS